MSAAYLRGFITSPGAPEGAPQTWQRLAEFRNGHGFGPMIWSALCSRYLGNGASWMWGGLTDLPVARMTAWEKVALQTTYDLAFVRAQDVQKKWGESLIDFSIKHNDSRYINHLPAIVDAAFKAVKEHPGLIALGLYQDVGDDNWHIREAGLDDGRPYDLTQDIGHTFIEV